MPAILNRAPLMLFIGVVAMIAITVIIPYIARSQQEGRSEAMPAEVTPTPEPGEQSN